MNEIEISRLAHALNELRPDWPISSVRTFIAKSPLASKPYRDVAVVLAWVATDTKVDGTPASEYPKRVLEAGPWWQAVAHTGSGTGIKHAPRRGEECPHHPGSHATNCGGCRADQLAGETAPPHRPARVDPTPHLDAARAALRPAPAAGVEEDSKGA